MSEVRIVKDPKCVFCKVDTSKEDHVHHEECDTRRGWYSKGVLLATQAAMEAVREAPGTDDKAKGEAAAAWIEAQIKIRVP